MKTIFWLAALVLVGLLGYLLHGFIEGRKAQTGFYNFEVSSEEAARYLAQADSLERIADSLRVRLDRVGLLRRGPVRQHLALVEDELAALRSTIELWGKSRATRRDIDLYRKVVLLYGEASAAARALAADTLADK
jgi:hypothetical protein